jgi:hypothetical protein
MGDLHEQPGQPRINITLVHGTWPKGWLPKLSKYWARLSWFEPGSEFLRLLKQGLREWQPDATVEIQSFIWSGKNSFKERHKAAEALAAMLVAQRTTAAKGRQIVIAHSHGGNVALLSLCHVPSEFPGIELITLATPFLEVRRQIQARSLADKMHRAMRRVMPPRLRRIAQWSLMSSLKLERRNLRTLSMVSRYPILSRYSFLRRLLVIRAVDDEAALVLAFGAAANRLASAIAIVSRNALAVLSIVIGVAIPIVTALIFAAVDNRIRFKTVDLLAEPTFFLARIILPLVALLPLLGILVSRMCRLVFGTDVRADSAELNLQSVPDLCGVPIEVRTLPQERFKRRHSLPGAPRSVDVIVTWIYTAESLSS